MYEWWNDLSGGGQLISWLLLASVILAPIVWYRPEVLSKNTFLENFIPHQIMPVLALILTITFGAVVTTHDFLTKIVRELGADQQVTIKLIDKIRNEIDSGAWCIFWAFVTCIIALIIKGWVRKNSRGDAAMIGVCLIVLIANGLIFHDIYGAAFNIAPLIPKP